MAESHDAVAGMLASAAACLFLAAASEEKKKQKPKRYWIKEYRKTRRHEGNTQLLMKELNPNSPDFKHFLRMDEETFEFILDVIRNDIKKQNTNMRAAITPEEKLAVTLRFLATGESFMDLDYNSKLSKPFLSMAIMDVCNAIFRNLKDQFIKFPTTQNEWTKIADDFSLKWQFPNCLGAIDGKHIAFRPSKKIAPLYYNYKGFHSIVLLGIADAYGKFIFVDVGCNGRISDGGVLQRSNFQYILQQPEKYLPQKKYLGNGRLLPHVFVADNAFPLTATIMTPYPFTTTDECKKTFNRRLSRARQNIERAFGILSNRFRILQTTINLNQQKVKEIVLCSCVLHNLLITRSRWYMEEINIQESDTTTYQMASSSQTGDVIRRELTEYFNQEGSI